MIHVLIVEDDPMVAKFNKIYVESIPGFTVVGVADNAEEGRQIFQTVDVDLILLDVYMAEMTGLALLKDFRQSESPVDVIMISAANDKESIQTALYHGAVDYLIKPFSFERFQEALLGYAEKHHAMKNLDHIRQEDLDVFLLKGEKQPTPTVNLPKGLTEHTLATIVKEVIDWPSNPFSTADLATVTGISRVSVRKYLNFLVDMNLVSVKIVYQEAGRPLHQFQLELDKKGVLKAMIT